MAMGACPEQIPMPCVPPALMVTETMVRACRRKLHKSVTQVLINFLSVPQHQKITRDHT